MGYSYKNATFYKANGKIDVKAEIDSLYNWSDEITAVSVVKSSVVNGVYYAALSVANKKECSAKTVGEVVLTDICDGYFNFGYKAMSETMLPYFYDCPASILKLLDTTDDADALEWRRRCLERIASKKANETFFKKSKYKVSATNNGKPIIDYRNGYIFEKYGLSFGVCKDYDEWIVTDLKTGFIVAKANTKKAAVDAITQGIAEKIKKAHTEESMKKYIDMMAAA